MTIDHPLQLARGSHRAGSLKGCGGNVLSWEQGDAVITDFPSRVAVPLASLIHWVNDRICDHPVPGSSADLLCPACSVLVLDFAHRTVGTGQHPIEVAWEWMRRVTADAIDWLRTRQPSHGSGYRIMRGCGLLGVSMVPMTPISELLDGLREAELYAAGIADRRTTVISKDAGLVAGQRVRAAMLALAYHVSLREVLVFAHHAVDVWHELAGSTPTPVPAEVTERAVARMQSAAPWSWFGDSNADAASPHTMTLAPALPFYEVFVTSCLNTVMPAGPGLEWAFTVGPIDCMVAAPGV